MRVPDIGGQLYVAADGYVPAYVPVSQAKNGVLDIALVRSFIGSNGQVRHPAFEAVTGISTSWATAGPVPVHVSENDGHEQPDYAERV